MTVWTTGARRVVMARPWLSAATAVVLIGGGIGAYVWIGAGNGTSASAQTSSRLVSVTSGTVRQAVSTTGTLTPADQEDVSFGSAAEITSVRVKQGDKVSKGQVLGTIATLSLTSALAQANAQLAGAKATLTSDEDSSSTTAAQLTADKAAVSIARSSVTDATSALAGATLRSPISGTVAEVNVTKGGQSSGSSAANTGTTGSTTTSGANTGSTTGSNTRSGSGANTGASTSTESSSGDFVVVGMKKWTVAATVDDTEVGLITKGDQAQITTDNVTGTVFGVVSSVSVLSSSSSGAASYPVVIAVTGTPAGLHDGAAATVAITYKQVTNVLTVPTLAVHRDTSSSYVYVSKNGAKTKATVRTGLASGGTTQITSGLTSGQQVYVDVPSAVTRRGGTSTQTNNRSGYFPGGGSGNFPGGYGGGGNFPGGYGGGGNFPARNGNGNAGGGAAGGNP